MRCGRTLKKWRKEESDAENADIAAPTRVWRAGGRGQAALESGERSSEGACWIVAFICKMRRCEAAQRQMHAALIIANVALLRLADLLFDSLEYSGRLQPSASHALAHGINSLFHLMTCSLDLSRVNVVVLLSLKPHPLDGFDEGERHAAHSSGVHGQQVHGVARDCEAERVVAVDERGGVRALQRAERQRRGRRVENAVCRRGHAAAVRGPAGVPAGQGEVGVMQDKQAGRWSRRRRFKGGGARFGGELLQRALGVGVTMSRVRGQCGCHAMPCHAPTCAARSCSPAWLANSGLSHISH